MVVRKSWVIKKGEFINIRISKKGSKAEGRINNEGKKERVGVYETKGSWNG